MINLGSTSIADVKFGSQQISKAYFGSDLVWEKDDEMITLKIGTNHNSDPDGLILASLIPTGYYASSVSAYGFSLSSTLTSHGVGYTVRECFDGGGTNGFASQSTSSRTAMGIGIVFPFDINFIGFTGICHYNPPSSTNYKQAYHIQVFSIKNGENFTNRVFVCERSATTTIAGYSMEDTESTPFSNNKGIRGIQAVPIYSNENKKLVFGELRLTIQVKKSAYIKWKADYNLTTNPNIP